MIPEEIASRVNAMLDTGDKAAVAKFCAQFQKQEIPPGHPLFECLHELCEITSKAVGSD
jgi:hypothetical protein